MFLACKRRAKMEAAEFKAASHARTRSHESVAEGCGRGVADKGRSEQGGRGWCFEPENHEI